MSESAFLQMLVLCGAAAGLVLLGGARALVARRSAGVRPPMTTVVALIPAAILAAAGYLGPAVASVGVVGAVAAGLALVRTEAFLARLLSLLRRLGQPGVQAAVLSAGGAALVVGSLYRYDAAVEAEYEADLDFMSKVTWRPPLDPVPDVVATTDAGRPVKLLQPEVGGRPAEEARAAEHNTLTNMAITDRLIRVHPATDGCNCHGWVFTGGRYWIGPEDVENILADNGYHQVSDPRPGDVAIYRDGGQITHTGLVRTGGAGMPVLLESKWGWMGVFLHRPEDTCYGRHYAFYRGPRETHVLAGLGAPSTPASDGTHTVAANWDPISGFVGH